MWSHEVSTFFFNEMRCSLKKVKASGRVSISLSSDQIVLTKSKPEVKKIPVVGFDPTSSVV
jgi:hypothetical protein